MQTLDKGLLALERQQEFRKQLRIVICRINLGDEMDIKTTFSCGDKAWSFVDDRVGQLTIGRVQVTVTNTPGVEGGSIFDNYRAQNSYEESYMCIETGVGSGSVYTLGKHIFKTEEECVAANEKRIAEINEAREKRLKRVREEKLSREQYLRQQLAEIEALKAE